MVSDKLIGRDATKPSGFPASAESHAAINDNNNNMKDIFIQTIHSRIAAHYPEKLLQMQQAHSYSGFLESATNSVFEQWFANCNGEDISECFRLIRALLIDEFGPSRYDYVEAIISSRFPQWHDSLVTGGIATYEIINITTLAEPFFEQYPLDHNTDPRPELEQLILSIVADYRKQTFLHTIL